MDTNQFSKEIRFQSLANAIQGNLFQRTVKRCASSARFDREDAFFFQCADNIPDDYGIDARGKSQHLTCYFFLFSVLRNHNEAMDGNRAFGTYMHNQVPPVFTLSNSADLPQYHTRQEIMYSITKGPGIFRNRTQERFLHLRCGLPLRRDRRPPPVPPDWTGSDFLYLKCGI